jgi:molecular chaperone GrpE
MAIERPKDLTVEQAWDMYLRAQATIDNMTKQHLREVRAAREGGREGVIREMLPIMDSLETGNRQAAQYRGRGGPISNLKEGFDVVTKQARSTLSGIGVNPFACQYEEFDPHRMDAIARQPTTELEPGHVFEELQRGYTIHDKVLRPAKVAVSEKLLLGEEDNNG